MRKFANGLWNLSGTQSQKLQNITRKFSDLLHSLFQWLWLFLRKIPPKIQHSISCKTAKSSRKLRQLSKNSYISLSKNPTIIWIFHENTITSFILSNDKRKRFHEKFYEKFGIILMENRLRAGKSWENLPKFHYIWTQFGQIISSQTPYSILKLCFIFSFNKYESLFGKFD